MRNAIIAVEDERYYENEGVDVRGIARAFYQDVIRGGARQGGSTITQQFVKNALEAQSDRTLFQKLREAALAYHLTRKWSKSKILREYLNSIYFGNGAYGIESAARVYFGSDPNHAGCGTRARPCAQELTAGRGGAARRRRRQPDRLRPGRPSRGRARAPQPRAGEDARAGQASRGRVPGRHRAGAAGERSCRRRWRRKAPYFTTWVSQQLVERFGARRAFEGGLRVKTTLDLDLQERRASARSTATSPAAGPGGGDRR